MSATPSLPDITAALSKRGIDVSEANVRLGRYGDSEQSCVTLISLIAAKTKRATSSLLWSWEIEGERLPREGDIEIVLDYSGKPALVLRTTMVDIVSFGQISNEFARAEGEDDLSLESWRTRHWKFFTEECERLGRKPAMSMPLVCETFDLLADLHQ